MPRSVVRVEVHGVQSTLRVLKQFDVEYFNEVQSKLKGAVDPIVKDAASQYPSGNVLSNWGPWKASGLNPTRTGAKGTAGGRKLDYTGGNAARRIRANTSRKSRRTASGRAINLVAVTQWSTAGAILELAGAKTPSVFADNLARALGSNSSFDSLGGRILPRAVRRNFRKVEASVGEIIDDLMKRTQRRLDEGGGVDIRGG